MREVAVKTHLIITDIHDEFEVKWYGKLKDAKPVLKNGLPIFALVSGSQRIELNTVDMKRIEDIAKKITRVKGKGSVTTDKVRIYLKEEGGNEMLIGQVIHKRVKTFAPMYDKIGYRD